MSSSFPLFTPRHLLGALFAPWRRFRAFAVTPSHIHHDRLLGPVRLALTVAAYSVLPRDWAWTAATAAHVFAVGGVLLGMAALAVGAGPPTELNTIYHRVMLVALVAVLTLVLSPAGRSALRRA